MRLLDLFCGAGGAAMGYHQAGFDEIVGVDNRPMSRYPFTFVLGDALEYCTAHGHEFDAIHASPPCQRYSVMSNCDPELAGSYPDLVPSTRDLLKSMGLMYVIENVPGAVFTHAIMLCGTMFDIKVYRHRYFECFPYFLGPAHGPHQDKTPRAGTGLVSPKGFISVAGTGGPNFTYKKQAMGIDWMTRAELSEAIPPAYTRFIGEHLLLAARGEVTT